MKNKNYDENNALMLKIIVLININKFIYKVKFKPFVEKFSS